MNIDKCILYKFPINHDLRGTLTFLESSHHIPFEIRRIYYLSDVPAGLERGHHAHKVLHQIIIPISGSFDIELDDGRVKKTVHLNQINEGLYICPMIWRVIKNFSPGAICLVLASEQYSELDYYHDYKAFLLDASKVKE
jgi:hypothetical protein